MSTAFVCFDYSNPSSIHNIPIWIQEAYENECYLIIVCGLKTDLCKTEVDDRYINEFLSEYRLEDRLQKFSCKEYRENAIKRLFHEIDNDVKMDRSTIVRAARFSRTSSIRRTYLADT